MVMLLISFLMSLLIVRLIKVLCIKVRVFDVPNGRSSHKEPTALMGGIGFVLSFLFTLTFFPFFLFNNIQLNIFLMSLGLISLIGLLDDLKGIKARLRLFIQIFAALGVTFSGIQLSTLQFPGWEINLSFLSVFLSVFFLVSTINIFNFMDGIDGYAGGVSLIGSLSLAWLGYIHNDPSFMMLMLLTAAVVSGFLVWNLPKASIFMGDVGSTFLGLLLGASSIYVSQFFMGISIVVPIIIFSVFLMDASVTMTGRLCRGQKFWQAHRSHFYQKLHQTGWSHTQVILLEFSHMAILCGIALNYSTVSNLLQLAFLASVFLSFVAKFSWVQFRFKKILK
ncbi:hypothetical protein DID80_02555 [Candidatus Marinamargulisbacteria bacterium SCGC AAA071-K20]|nr:hypothetical protein DID80_02555 [Candidatus Marinamargulisbacteria bacterium SCGC AAA071-K20]